MAITQKQALEAVSGSKGFVTVIARRLGVDRTYIYRLMEKWPSVAEALRDEREATKDWVEGKLLSKIEKDDIVAILFYLKTQAKDRGYVERAEYTGADGAPLPAPVIYLPQVEHDSNSDSPD